MEVNAAGTAAMLDCYEGSAANLFVYASSFYLIGHPLSTPVREDHPVAPTNPYHASKYAGEVACLEYSRRTGRPVVAFRITAPYGPGMAPSVLDLFLRRAMKGERLSLYGSGSRRQNFIYVDDIFQACLEVAKASTSISGLFNLGGLESVSMIDLARLACATAGRGCDLIDVNIVPDPQEDYRIEVDIGKIINIIPYLTLTNLRDGVQKYHNFLEKKTSWSGFWN
jgi:nucleoside-diphosphate-sugar epimerase